MSVTSAIEHGPPERPRLDAEGGPFVVFELGSEAGGPDEAPRAFALDVVSVLHVVEPQRVSPVPLAPAVVRGIINHHGRIVTLLDPALVLGQPSQPPLPPHNDRLAQVVVLRDGTRATGNLGLLVARIRRIVPVTELKAVDVPPAPCVTKVFQYGKRVMHIVDTQALLAALLHDFDAVSR